MQNQEERDAFLSPALLQSDLFPHIFNTLLCCMHMALSLWTTQGTVGSHNSWARVTDFGQWFFSIYLGQPNTAIIGALLKLPRLHCPPPVTLPKTMALDGIEEPQDRISIAFEKSSTWCKSRNYSISALLLTLPPFPRRHAKQHICKKEKPPLFHLICYSLK